MLTIKVLRDESFDNETQTFIEDYTTLRLEHSLASLSKWEAEFEKAFLGPDKKTTEEIYGYVRAMSLDGEIPGDVLMRLSEENFKSINEYIEAKMTATWFRETPGTAPSREIITADLIRHWMIQMNIPLEYENRHLNQLFTLMKVISEKNKPQKKMSAAELARRNRDLNAQRKSQLNTSG